MSHVVCVGLATLDTIFAVPELPEPDGRVIATDLAVGGGGPAATAAAALARLGVETYFVGAVGDDECGTTIRDGLQREGIDVSELTVVAGARSPRSTILVEHDRRAIVHDPGTLPPRTLSERAHALCRDAAWVHVDHVGYGIAPHDVRLSIDGGNPIDGLDLRGVALYAPPEFMLHETFGDAQAALDAGAELVVVTNGSKGCSAWRENSELQVRAYGQKAIVSTLGAGDVFHGALLAQFVLGRPLKEALVAANVAAALSCRALDGRSAIPTAHELERKVEPFIASA